MDGLPSSQFNGVPVPIEIFEEEDVSTLRQLITMELGIPFDSQDISYNSTSMEIGRTIKSYAIPDGEIVHLSIKLASRSAPTAASVDTLPSDITPENLMQLAKSNSSILNQLKHQDPEIATAIESNDVNKLRVVMMTRYLQKHKVVHQQRKEMSEIAANPDNEENQRKIEEKVCV